MDLSSRNTARSVSVFSVCLSASMSVSLFVSVSLSVGISVSLRVHLSDSLSVKLSVCLFNLYDAFYFSAFSLSV